MANIQDILIIFFISLIIGGILGYILKSRKVTRKDYRQEDYARDKNKGTDVRVDL